MKDYVNEHFKKHHELTTTGEDAFQMPVPTLYLANGESLSVQAGEMLYSEPRKNMAQPYSKVEVGFPSTMFPTLMPYAEDPEKPTETVYGYVPVEIVNQLIEDAGGLKDE